MSRPSIKITSAEHFPGGEVFDTVADAVDRICDIPEFDTLKPGSIRSELTAWKKVSQSSAPSQIVTWAQEHQASYERWKDFAIEDVVDAAAAASASADPAPPSGQSPKPPRPTRPPLRSLENVAAPSQEGDTKMLHDIKSLLVGPELEKMQRRVAELETEKNVLEDFLLSKNKELEEANSALVQKLEASYECNRQLREEAEVGASVIADLETDLDDALVDATRASNAKDEMERAKDEMERAKDEMERAKDVAGQQLEKAQKIGRELAERSAVLLAELADIRS